MTKRLFGIIFVITAIVIGMSNYTYTQEYHRAKRSVIVTFAENIVELPFGKNVSTRAEIVINDTRLAALLSDEEMVSIRVMMPGYDPDKVPARDLTP